MDIIKTEKKRNLSELKQDIVLIKLSAGMSVAAIARELDVNANHIHGYLRSCDGFERLESSLVEARHVLDTRLPELIEKSLKVLDETLSAPYMSPEKLKAAQLIVTTVSKLSSSPKPCPNCDVSRIV